MTNLSNTPRIPDEGCGFYTDLPDHSRNGDSAGRGSSSLPGSRDRFPPLNDAREDRLSRVVTWSDRLATFGQIALVALLFVMLAVHLSGVWDGATTHPDPVEVQ